MTGSVSRLLRVAALSIATLAVPLSAAAQSVRTAANAQGIKGVILDQSGLPVPGASIQLLEGTTEVATTTSGADGTYALEAGDRGTSLVVTLEGFETKTVAPAEAEKIVLEISRLTDSATVTASTINDASPTAPVLGGALTATNIVRLPSKNFNARESLPLLPSVIRGADGLMQLGGARAYQTPLALDGFNIADPATGLSSVNLPFEAVKGIEALRDPMSVTYGGLLGGLVKIESNVGAPDFNFGVQGFIPRPRFATPGFGRLEGIFPRAHVSGSAANGRVQYLTAVEYDYERIPVPEVTGSGGPDLVEESAIVFSRVDAQVAPRARVTFEGFSAPAHTEDYGLSPRRTPAATVDLSSRDLFFGVTGRVLTTKDSVLTIRANGFGRDAEITPNGFGDARLSPGAWTNNWFSRTSRTATRYGVSAAWERVAMLFGRPHDLSIAGDAASQNLRGRIEETPIEVIDPQERIVRTVDFGLPQDLAADDRLMGMAFRDVLHVNNQLQIESGARLDSSRVANTTPSARLGLRWALDAASRTVVKGGIGTFVGTLPLAAATFGRYPTRLDRSYEPETGSVVRNAMLTPAIGRLLLPRARTAVIGIERALTAALDVQAIFTRRDTSRLATVHVPEQSGDLLLESNGEGRYQELQLSARHRWPHDQQLFVSYVRSTSMGELNEFSSLFQAMDVPLLQPGGQARTANDARHRVLLWGTFNLPRRIVVSPVTELRSGFPYSNLTMRYHYAGTPHSENFPLFMATDMVIYKTFTARGRTADAGIQLFNLTNHHNYRDVYPVTNAPRYGTFANSVGPILRGYFLLKW
jgi:hypothetical protein